MNGDYDPRSDESFLIDRLSSDVGVKVTVPDDPEERWVLLRSLMNVRPPMVIPDEVMKAQDRYLSHRVSSRNIVDVDDLVFNDNISLWRGDITTLSCDAIVNAANSGMLGCFVPCHRCIDNAIHSFAGMGLRRECDSIMKGSCEHTGSARITGAYNLPSRYVIHTVGPIVKGNPTDDDKDALRSCYNSCLGIADKNGLKSIAFCCISTGEFHFPNEDAAEIAVEVVKSFLNEHPYMKVIFDVFTERDYRIYSTLL